MKLPSVQVLLVVLLFAGVGALCDAEDNADGYDKRSAAYWEFSWESPAGIPGPRGLRLWDSGPGGYAMRLLVLDAERRWRLILTETLDPRRGVHSTEIRDDVSGWWVRLEHRPGARGESLADYFARARELPTMDEATGFLDYRLTASGGVSFAPRIPARDATGEVIWDGLFDQIEAAGLGRRLSEDVPDDFRAAVLFLDTSLMDWASATEAGAVADRPRTWPGLLGLLARVLRSELAPDDPLLDKFATPWTMRRIGPIGKTASIVEPDLLELVSHFHSVENADPLAGSRVEDFAAPSPTPDR